MFSLFIVISILEILFSLLVAIARTVIVVFYMQLPKAFYEAVSNDYW